MSVSLPGSRPAWAGRGSRRPPQPTLALLRGPGTAEGSKAPDVVEERLKALPRWLVAISARRDVSLHPAFRSFLQLDQFERELAE